GGNRNVQAACQVVDALEGKIARSSLDVGHVGAMQTGASRQFLLRDPEAPTAGPQSGGEGPLNVVPGGFRLQSDHGRCKCCPEGSPLQQTLSDIRRDN